MRAFAEGWLNEPIGVPGAAGFRRRSTGRAMTAAHQDALEMLDAFASVGAQRFDITVTDIAGQKVEFRGNRPLEWLRPALATPR
jgi:hypothetical protein